MDITPDPYVPLHTRKGSVIAGRLKSQGIMMMERENLAGEENIAREARQRTPEGRRQVDRGR